MYILLLLFAILCSARAEISSHANCAPPSSLPYKFSVCTMVHDEARYVEEWVAYHLLLNVGHFYIYNDRSSDNIAQVLSPYIEQGYVSLIYWNGNQTVSTSLVTEDPKYTRDQRFALADCIYNHRSESEWFGIWDVDEFLTLGDPYHDITSFLEDYLVQGGLDEYHIPMTIFGASGHSTTPDGLVIENYQWRSNVTMFGTHPYTNKFTGKSLYKSGCAVPEVHWSPHLPEGCRLDYSWRKIEGENNLPLSLNHYFQKSWDDFEAKMAKWGWGANKDDFDKSMVAYSQFHDMRMAKYINPLKELQNCMRS